MTLALWTAGTPDLWRTGKQPKGTWYPHPLGPHTTLYERLVTGQRVVIYVACPLCGKTMSLAHAIGPKGALSPSIVCPFGPCTWHVFETLGSWPGGTSTLTGKR